MWLCECQLEVTKGVMMAGVGVFSGVSTRGAGVTEVEANEIQNNWLIDSTCS